MSADLDWLDVRRGEAPLVVSLPHAGVDIPSEIEGRLASSWLGRRDTDWWLERLYGFAEALGVTLVRTSISRSVIDVNRDPSGRSLYPGAATTELCPTTTFDGEPLYRPSEAPAAAEISDRRRRWFDPYHAALEAELTRLTARHGAVVLYDAHSIRSRIPRLFEGELPHLNIGTNGGLSCDRRLTDAVVTLCARSPFSFVVDGRFKGGWITRRHGRPDLGVHALQMELACRAYMDEPVGDPTPRTWPPPFEPARAESLVSTLKAVLDACLDGPWLSPITDTDRP